MRIYTKNTLAIAPIRGNAREFEHFTQIMRLNVRKVKVINEQASIAVNVYGNQGNKTG